MFLRTKKIHFTYTYNIDKLLFLISSLLCRKWKVFEFRYIQKTSLLYSIIYIMEIFFFLCYSYEKIFLLQFRSFHLYVGNSWLNNTSSDLFKHLFTLPVPVSSTRYGFVIHFFYCWNDFNLLWRLMTGMYKFTYKNCNFTFAFLGF